MGVDFMRLRAARFVKSLDQSRVDLARKHLFTREADCIARDLVAKSPGSRLVADQEVLVRLANDRLVLMEGIEERGEVVKPPADVLDHIAATGGFATARVTRTLPTLDLAVVSLR